MDAALGLALLLAVALAGMIAVAWWETRSRR